MIRLFNLCKHDYKLMAAIGGDTQARAYACRKCGKKKVKVDGINGKPDYYYVLRNGKKFQ